MRFVSLAATNNVYACAKSFTVVDHTVDQAEFKTFAFELSRFQQALGDLINEDYWQNVLRPLRRYRFQFSAIPLPFDYFGINLVDTAEKVKAQLALCDSMFPEFTSEAYDLLGRWMSIMKLNDNPLLEPAKQIQTAAAGGTSCLLAIQPRLTRFIPDVQDIISKHHQLHGARLGGIHDLCSGDCYDRLIIFGPVSRSTAWLPDSILYAPRAREIHLIRYSWMAHKIDAEPIFAGFPAGNAGTVKRILDAISQGEVVGKKVQTGAEYLDPDELLPTVNWVDIKRRLTLAGASDRSDDEAEREDIEAQLFLMEGGLGVLLDATEGSRATVIEFDENSHPQVLKIPIDSVVHGMFILVRTAGGGEFIVPVADTILGKESTVLRDKQRHWKTLLRKFVASASLGQATIQLKKLGAQRASETNIRNWMSYRSIKTEDYSDFYAVMRLIGLEQKAQEYWEAMLMIDNAHLRAGQYIRKLLLKRVHEANIEELEKLGKIDFELPGAKAGSLTVIRVSEIYPETMKVPVSRLGHLVDLQEE